MATTLTTATSAATQALASQLGVACRGGEVLLLLGPLGAGKTTFTQGFARGLGVTEYVHSPTFTLVNQYQGRLTLYHLDLYRIESIAETVDLGLDDYLYAGGVCVIEWAEKALEAFPQEHLQVEFSDAGGDRRSLRLTANGARYVEMLKALSQTTSSH